MNQQNHATTEATRPDVGPFPGKLHYSTAKAVDFFKHGKPGESVTRQRLAEIIQRTCTPGSLGYGNVNSAIRHVEANFGIVWRWDTNRQAWVCLGPAECVGETKTQIRTAGRRIKRAVTVAKAVDVAALDDDTRREHNINVAISGMMLTAGSSSLRKQVAQKAELAQPDTKRLAALFGNGQG